MNAKLYLFFSLLSIVKQRLLFSYLKSLNIRVKILLCCTKYIKAAYVRIKELFYSFQSFMRDVDCQSIKSTRVIKSKTRRARKEKRKEKKDCSNERLNSDHLVSSQDCPRPCDRDRPRPRRVLVHYPLQSRIRDSENDVVDLVHRRRVV